jgi:hypothetical protein
LARYDQRFPAGKLRPEAERARVDALLRLERRRQALEVLERMGLGELGAGELRVLRGELRAESGRYRPAIEDFDTVLGASPQTRLEERALYGRAVSRARSADGAASRRDFERYLQRFPNGKFSIEAKKAVGL